MTGAELIAAERIRQFTDENYDSAHDDEHDEGELAMAAVCYAAPEPVYVRGPYGRRDGVAFEDPWPWDYSDDRRALKPRVGKSRIRELVKAGALIAADVDRLQRDWTGTTGARVVGSPAAAAQFTLQRDAWWMGAFALLLADVRATPFVPMKGALGFFKVPDEIAKMALEVAA